MNFSFSAAQNLPPNQIALNQIVTLSRLTSSRSRRHRLAQLRFAVGLFAISLAAQNVVRAQADAPATSSSATIATSSTRSDSASGANANDVIGGALIPDASGNASGATSNATATISTTAIVDPNALTARDATTPVVTSRGVVVSGLADARNREDANAPVFTLADALTLALTNNPTIQSAQAAVRAAQARVGTARSTGGVQVGLSGNVDGSRSYGGTSSTGFGGGSGGVGSGGGTQVGNDILGFNTNESAGISATLPIYNGGRVKASTRAAQAAVDVQNALALQTQQDLLLNTTSSYLNILRADQLLTVAENNAAVSREQLRIAQVRYNAGAAARLEVFQAQSTLADADQRRTAASASLGQNKASLNTLLARAPETPIRVEPISSLQLQLPSSGASPLATTIALSTNNGAATNATATNATATNATATNAISSTGNAAGETITEPNAPLSAGDATTPASAAAASATVSSAQLRAQAALSRPQLAASQAQIAAANASVDLARAQRKPSLGLSLGALLRNPVSFAGRFALSIGLGLSQSLFDSGRTRSQISEAQSLLEQSRANLSSTQLNVGNEIEQTLLTLDSAQARTVSARTAVEAAQEALRAAQIGYNAGVRTSFEVFAAQTQLLTAQTNEVNARFDVATGQAQLASAIGVLTAEGQTAANRARQSQAANNAIVQAQPKKKRKKFLGIF